MLDLVGLAGIIEDQGVQISLASDLELDLLCGLALVGDGCALHAGS